MESILSSLSNAVEHVAALARGWPFILLLVGTGVYLTFLLRGIQFRALRQGLAVAFGRVKTEKSQTGEVSSFQALTTVLSGTIGTGNIAGVATAIVAGGPGAVFWMWVTGIVGMATKFACCALAHRYRRLTDDKQISGGPMYTLRDGLNMPFLAGIFSVGVVLASFGSVMVQSHSVASGVAYIIPQAEDYLLVVGAITAVLVAIVIIGGVKRIAHVASLVVPFMTIAYCSVGLLILCLNWQDVPAAFGIILKGAFYPAAVGGGALGATIHYGVARALFVSEAGQGTAPIVLASAKTDEPVRAGLIGMVGPLFDTLLISTMTALVIILSGGWLSSGGGDVVLNGSQLSAYAFETTLTLGGFAAGRIGAVVVGLSLIFFAYTTMIAWSYYGLRGIDYLFGEKWIMPYRLIYTALIIVGSLGTVHVVWNIADITNIAMAIPNLISLLLLSKTLKEMVAAYQARYGFRALSGS